ncbi:hypothetical protein GTHT12_02621 [Geobacillus thermodenitrificans]|uniref:hypothetical protein n=1 Tax=Geobacillus thermodenitrificans TaxID=33940 RepID=UPI000A29490B|nr:hypothetical protein [Geobacillus thermodenitrificans]ARP44119.1 hypothetical protein GTHT12_02621 [Geobacillus thermodenitrificans]
MKTFEILQRIEEVYTELEEALYTYGDYPFPQDERILRNDGYISPKLLDELRGLIDELQAVFGNSQLILEIQNLIHYDGPINKYSKFNEHDYCFKEIAKDIEAYDEELDVREQVILNKAADIKEQLFNKMYDDIRKLMEDLLPRLLNL